MSLKETRLHKEVCIWKIETFKAKIETLNTQISILEMQEKQLAITEQSKKEELNSDEEGP